MDNQYIISEYKRLMKLYYPQLSQISKSVNKEKYREFKKRRFYKKGITTFKVNNFAMLTQPINCWTQQQINDAKKVIYYIRKSNIKPNKPKLKFRYKKPLYWWR